MSVLSFAEGQERSTKTWATGMYPPTNNVHGKTPVSSHGIKVPHGNPSIWTQLTLLAKELLPPSISVFTV